jgi:hypothetical protein
MPWEDANGLFPGRGALVRRPPGPWPPGRPPVEPGRGLGGAGLAPGVSGAGPCAAGGGTVGAGPRCARSPVPGWLGARCPGAGVPAAGGAWAARASAEVAAVAAASRSGAKAAVRSPSPPADGPTASTVGVVASPSVSAGAAAGAAAFFAAFLTGGGSLANFSLSRLSTGASIVDEADRTNSPMSFRMVRTVLLSTPSSFASS